MIKKNKIKIMEEVAMDVCNEAPYQEKNNTINNDEIIDLLKQHINSEFKRIENYIIQENNNLSKKSEIEDLEHSMVQKLTRSELEIHNFGAYNFEIRKDSIDSYLYTMGKRLVHHFEFEENGKKTQIGIKYEKVLNDILFYKLPEEIRKEFIRKEKLKTIL